MVIHTTRFGSIHVSDEDVLSFTQGILGFKDLVRFVLLDDPEDDIFIWLQSCEEPGVAFPVLEPELFQKSYDFCLTPSELENLEAQGESDLRAFCIVTIPEDPAQMTANLKAPILVNGVARLASQCILPDNGLEVRKLIFTQLQQRVVKGSSKSLKSLSSDWGVTVQIKDKKVKTEMDSDPSVSL